MSGGGEDLLVGLAALALVPMIGWRILRGLREERLPLYRTYVERADAAAKFNALLVLHVISLLVVAFVAADLMLGLSFRWAR